MVQTLNNFNYVDDDDDVIAEHVNELLAGSLVSRFKNVEVLSGTRTLLDLDTPLQNFDCNGVDRDVLCPEPNTVTNHVFFVVNASENTITVKNNEGTYDVAVILPSTAALVIPDGAGNYIAVGSGSGSSGGSGGSGSSGGGADENAVTSLIMAFG